MSWLPEPTLLRVAIIAALAILVHLAVRSGYAFAMRALAPEGADQVRARLAVARRYPKVATLLSLAVSTVTFVLWFVALGFILDQLFGVDLATYFVSATVIGLAVGFGSQGLVQDVVIGLTLIFTDVVDVGDMVEVSGQVGRVERVGLRFTTLTNFQGQTVYIPNRNIAVVGRFRRDVVRAYVDVQIPDGLPEDDIAAHLHRLARGLRSQHPTAIVSDPELMGIRDADPGGWRFVRLKFRLWPGQQTLIEPGFRLRVVAWLKEVDERYADWMVQVTLRA